VTPSPGLRHVAADGDAPLRGPGGRPFRLSVPPVSGFLRLRLIAVCAALAAATFLAFCWSVSIGDMSMDLATVIRALGGSGEPGSLLVVREFRLPRALAGLLAGVAFGVSGALFQTMTRNALASPDMIGLTAGAGTAVVAAIVFEWHVLGTQTLGLLGALATALIVYALAWRGGTTGYRIILIGIGVSWICTSATAHLVARGGRFQAHAALGWLVGNLNGRTWENDVLPLAVALAVLLPAALLLSRLMRTLQLGDDVAVGLGTPVQPVRVALMLTGVGLVAFATASAGPIAFVALAAPQIAQRLAGTAFPPMVAGGLTGALIVLGGDVVARVLIAGSELPVGVVTGAFGAPVLLWLLVRANRAGSGG
jgi:iron complex transport system permease protein